MKNLIQAAVVTLFAASTAQAQQAVRWKVSVGGNGHWYQVMSNPAGVQHWTFAGAKSFAESRGGHLAMFENLAESAALHALLQVSAVSPSSAVWVGLYQDRTASDYSEPAGGWRWVDGRQLHFNPWLPWEPSNACGWQPNAPQDWGAWTGGSAGSGQLDDMGDPFPNCDNVVWFCAIEWSADCNDDGIIDYGQCRDGSLPDYNGNNVPDCCESGTPCVVGRYPIQWRTQDGGNGHWYKVDRFGGQLSWASASLRAQDAGGHLACLSSAHENSFVFSLIASDPSTWNDKNGPWIGARREGGTWSWVNGEAWSFTNWCGGTGTVEHRGQYWACSGTTP
ncbi:MAG: C-type lectin domain-containing protein, partial [Phycisphaerales bacterium]